MTGNATLTSALTALISADPGVSEILPAPARGIGLPYPPTNHFLRDATILVTETGEEVSVTVSLCTSRKASTPDTLRRLAAVLTNAAASTDSRTLNMHLHVASID